LGEEYRSLSYSLHQNIQINIYKILLRNFYFNITDHLTVPDYKHICKLKYIYIYIYIYGVCVCVYIYTYIYIHTYIHTCGAGSSVGIATDYGLDDLRSNPDGDKIFRPGVNPASCTMDTGSLPG